MFRKLTVTSPTGEKSKAQKLRKSATSWRKWRLWRDSKKGASGGMRDSQHLQLWNDKWRTHSIEALNEGLAAQATLKQEPMRDWQHWNNKSYGVKTWLMRWKMKQLLKKSNRQLKISKFSQRRMKLERLNNLKKWNVGNCWKFREYDFTKMFY